MAKWAGLVNGDGLGLSARGLFDDGYCLLDNQYRTSRQLDNAVGAAAYHARQQEAVDLGCFLDTSFRRSRSKSSHSAERPLISFCSSIACCLRDSVASCLVEASACRCPARLPAHVKK